MTADLHPVITSPPPLGVPTPRSGWPTRLLRGREGDPRWVRPALIALLLGAALLYLWDLGRSGWANSFYSAAVQAGTKSWKAFFFGSSDAANSITVDKPPASLWVMEISTRLFGVNSWAILVPQALEGVAAVGLLYCTVRRWFSPGAALIAGAVMALTPSAVLMFRFNNPDALLVLTLVAAAYATTRALERASTGWLVLAGSLVGFGFLAKMLQAFLVLPGFALAYLLTAPTAIRRRLWQLLASGAAVVGAAGWWVAIVSLVPAADRPYIGGSQHNSELELIFGYNGFGRLSGNETGSVTGGGFGRGGGGGGGGAGAWGPTGWTRLFGAEMGTQVSWLLPAALILLAGIALLAVRGSRDLGVRRLRGAGLMWGGWLLVTGATFSLAEGIIHPYYTVALAPAIGAVIGIGAAQLWRYRGSLVARLFLAATVAVTGWWAQHLLARTPAFYPWLRALVFVAGLVVAIAIALPTKDLLNRVKRPLAALVASSALAVGIAAPAAYAVDTAATPHTGSIPSAGPSGASNGGFGGPAGGRQQGGRGGGFGGFGGFTPPGQQGGQGGQQNNPQTGQPPSQTGQRPGQFGGGAGGFGGGAGGGLLDASTPSAALVTALQANASAYTWVAAAIGSNSASGYQLATGDPVMPIGGFNGSDPSPTLAQFQKLVQEHKIHYFIAGGLGQSNGGSNVSSQISQWVANNYTATTIGGITLYDLTS